MYAPNLLLLKLAGLNSVESEINLRKLLFLGRLITEPNMAPAVKTIFISRAKCLFDNNVDSLGVIPSIHGALCKYGLIEYLNTWFHNSTFPSYNSWKVIVKNKIIEAEFSSWSKFCSDHPLMYLANACLNNVSPNQFWAISQSYPDIVKHLHQQVRLWGSFGLNSSVPWLSFVDTSESACCFICKQGLEDIDHFLFNCLTFRSNFDTLWEKLNEKLIRSNLLEGAQICGFVNNLESFQKKLLLLGGIKLPFDRPTNTLIVRFVASAVGKICKIRMEKLRELEAPWLK